MIPKDWKRLAEVSKPFKFVQLRDLTMIGTANGVDNVLRRTVDTLRSRNAAVSGDELLVPSLAFVARAKASAMAALLWSGRRYVVSNVDAG